MTDDTYMPEQWSVWEMVCEYVRRHYGLVTDDMDVAMAKLKIEQPRFAAFIDDQGKRDADLLFDFLTHPPGLVVEESSGDILLTEHGRVLAQRWRREQAEEKQ